MRKEIKNIAEQLQQAQSEEEVRELLEANKDSLTEEDLQGLAGGMPVGSIDIKSFFESFFAHATLGQADVKGANAILDAMGSKDLDKWSEDFELKSKI